MFPSHRTEWERKRKRKRDRGRGRGVWVRYVAEYSQQMNERSNWGMVGVFEAKRFRIAFNAFLKTSFPPFLWKSWGEIEWLCCWFSVFRPRLSKCIWNLISRWISCDFINTTCNPTSASLRLLKFLVLLSCWIGFVYSSVGLLVAPTVFPVCLI